jgi:hypothetical protein
VGSAGVVRAQDAPFRIEPQRGQVSENSSKPSTNEHWGVFHEDETGSNLANDPGKFRPEAGALSFDSGALSCCADVLARKASRNDVNNSAPRSSVKTAHIRPNRERFEDSIILSLRQNLCGVGITLNGAHGSPSKDLAPENASTSACEKSQLIQFLSVLDGSCRWTGCAGPRHSWVVGSGSRNMRGR